MKSIGAEAPPTLDIAALDDRIDALLPQTQCRRCEYPACRPYAEAIARGEAPINRCPPGGEAGSRARAKLLGLPVLVLVWLASRAQRSDDSAPKANSQTPLPF